MSNTSLRSVTFDTGRGAPFCPSTEQRKKSYFLLTNQSKQTRLSGGMAGKVRKKTNLRCRLTRLMMFIMYACLSLCEYPRNEVTSGNKGFGILILSSRYYCAFGIESLHGYAKNLSVAVIFCRVAVLVTFAESKVTENAVRRLRNSFNTAFCTLHFAL